MKEIPTKHPLPVIRILVDGVAQGDFYWNRVRLVDIRDTTRTTVVDLPEIAVALDGLKPGETALFGGGALPVYEYRRLTGNEESDAVVKCPVHPDRDAIRALTIPCAPGGKWWVCQECFDAPPHSELARLRFEKYMASHRAEIASKRIHERIHRGRNN